MNCSWHHVIQLSISGDTNETTMASDTSSVSEPVIHESVKDRIPCVIACQQLLLCPMANVKGWYLAYNMNYKGIAKFE